MKKGLKITLITLCSLFGLVLIALGIVFFLIFTPARLTNIANKEIPKYLNCDFHLEKADLTLFKTFPKVGVELHDLVLVNPVKNAPTDTLLSVDQCIAAINIREILKNEHIIVHDFYLKNGEVNIFIDENNKSNLDIFKTDTTKPCSKFSYAVDLQKVVTENVNVNFVNLYAGMLAHLNDLDLNVKGKWSGNNVSGGKIKINTKNLSFKTPDSNAFVANYDKMKFRFNGDLADMNCLTGSINLDVKQVMFQVDTNRYVDSMDVSLVSDVNFLLKEQKARLENTQITLDKFKIDLNGTVARSMKDSSLALDLNYKTGSWKLQEVIAAIPRAIIGSALDKMEMNGKIALSGKVSGQCSVSQKPLITADVNWTGGTYALEGFPLTFQKINTIFNIDMDLNRQTDVTVKKLNCVTRNNKLAASGTIKDILNEMIFDVKLNGDLHVPDFADLLPQAVKVNTADAKASLQAHFNKNQLSNIQIDKMKASGNFQFKNLDVVYDDSIMVKSPDITLDVRFPVTEQPYDIGEWVETKITTQHLYGQKVGLAEISAENANVTAYLNDIMDSTTAFKVGAVYNFERLSGEMDTIDIQLSKPKGSFVLNDHNKMTLKYIGESLLAHIGENMTASTNYLNIHAITDYHENESTALMKWNPNIKLNFKNGSLVMNGLDAPVEIPNIKVDMNARQCNIQEGSVKIGNSDMTLKGEVHNIDKYFHGQDLMKGELELTSNLLDINQIMDLVQGFGAPDSLKKEKPQDGKENPFIVPYGFDLYMHTIIKKALYEDVSIRNVSGDVTIKDGVLVMEEMGFTHEAARMQLTALYKTPRKNHLFLGLDFHLLDIKIDQLIAMFPQVDTVLPMLKSFSGNAEFHFAIETYMKSNYDLKYSTLRGAAAINGQDLVVLDNETYRNISKKLLFNKKTENKIDSLSAEATIFKNEVDVYPFTVGIDKYQAILSGRHNLDMTYNYNISLVKPIRLGLDIVADTESRKFKLTKAKYATMYRPEKRNVVEDHAMQLKTLINTSLKRNVKEQPKDF